MTATCQRFLAERRDELGPGDPRMPLLERCLELYARRGVVDAKGGDLPLFRICPNRRTCWSEAERAATDEYPKSLDNAGVAAPWLGSRFVERRIVMVGINFNDYGGLGAHWHICRSHQDHQRRGQRGHDGRPFGFAAAAYVRAVVAALESRLVDVREPPTDPREVADAWDDCAFVEAVKCSPDRRAGEPYAPMFPNCTDLLLLDELALLAPAVVVVLGRSELREHVRRLFKQHDGLEWGMHPNLPSLERDQLRLNGQRAELISVNHPGSRGHWRRSYVSLVRSLTREPLVRE